MTTAASIASKMSRAAATNFMLRKFQGRSGRQYLVERLLQDKEERVTRVLLASNGDKQFVLKEIPPENYEDRRGIYQRIGQSPYVRTLEDTIPEHSIFVHTYLREDLLSMVRRRLPIALTKRILKDALRGIAALHERDVAHFDIKANNIMIDWNQSGGAIEIERVELIDLENSAHLPPNCAAKGLQLGNIMWRSPEAHAEGPIEKPSDMFSFGIVCIYAVLKRVIFAVGDEEVVDGTDKLAVVLERQISYFAEANTLEDFFQYLGPSRWYPLFDDILKDFGSSNPRLPFRMWEFDDDGFDEHFKDLVGRLTTFGPEKRLTAQEALRHEWFADVD